MSSACSGLSHLAVPWILQSSALPSCPVAATLPPTNTPAPTRTNPSPSLPWTLRVCCSTLSCSTSICGCPGGGRAELVSTGLALRGSHPLSQATYALNSKPTGKEEPFGRGTWAGVEKPPPPHRPHSQTLPGTSGSCWGWGFSPSTSGSAWKDTRLGTATRDHRAAPRAHRGELSSREGVGFVPGPAGRCWQSRDWEERAVGSLAPSRVSGAPTCQPLWGPLPVPMDATEA